jgi:DNA (cytosine-5)-methyltransferase 1
MLCVEFPCQPFLKADAQLGREDPGSGTLFALYVSQVHERAIVVAKQGKGALVDFVWQGRRRSCDELDIRGILEERADDAKYLPKIIIVYLDAWQRYRHIYPEDMPMASFPIWAKEFGASYPYL